MATNVVHEHGTEYIKLVATTAHRAGDLVYANGFYGLVEDAVVAGDLMTVRLQVTVNLPRVPSTLSQGIRVAAPATEMATTLPIGIQGATIGAATAGWHIFGRTIATGTATTAKIQLFNPNQFVP